MAGIWQDLARIRPYLDGKSDHLSGRIWPDPESSAGIGQSGQTYSPESGNGNRTLPNSGDSCQTLIFTFGNFFVQAKYRKIFLRKSFFLKMISSKIFYDENYFMSKQTEYKWLNTSF
jgi:hypothetical protein